MKDGTKYATDQKVILHQWSNMQFWMGASTVIFQQVMHTNSQCEVTGKNTCMKYWNISKIYRICKKVKWLSFHCFSLIIFVFPHCAHNLLQFWTYTKKANLFNQVASKKLETCWWSHLCRKIRDSLFGELWSTCSISWRFNFCCIQLNYASQSRFGVTRYFCSLMFTHLHSY